MTVRIIFKSSSVSLINLNVIEQTSWWQQYFLKDKGLFQIIMYKRVLEHFLDWTKKMLIFWICSIRKWFTEIKSYIKNILTGQVTFQHRTPYLVATSQFLHPPCEFLEIFCLNFFAGCQNSLPELLSGGELPPTLRSFAWGCSKGSQEGPGQGRMGAIPWVSPFMPIAANDAEVFLAAWAGALSCMKMILLRKAVFCTMEESSQKLYILYRGDFHIFRDPKWADQLSPHDFDPKHDSTNSLLTLQPFFVLNLGSPGNLMSDVH